MKGFRFGDPSFRIGGRPGFQHAIGQNPWWSSNGYRLANAAGGADFGPSTIVDFSRLRYALTRVASGDIAAADTEALADISSATYADAMLHTRASAMTAVGSDGLLYQAGVDEPAWDWSTGVRRLLRDIASTNLMPNANLQDWAVRGTGTAFETTGYSDPFGGMSAGRITGLQGATLNRVDKGYTTAETTHCFSVWLRGADGETITIGVELVEQQVTLTSGWKRYWVTNTVATTTTAVRIIHRGGDTADTVYVFGGQLEAQQCPTSYIPTNGVAASRAADVIRLTPKLEALLRRQKSTLVLKYRAVNGPNGRDARRYVLGGNSAGNSQYNIRGADTGAALPAAVIGDGASSAVCFSPASIAAGDDVALALAVDATESRFYVNGAASGNNPRPGYDYVSNAATEFYLGSNALGVNGETLLLQELRIYPFAATDATALEVSA